MTRTVKVSEILKCGVTGLPAGFSPDAGDALALTFAEPISQLARRRDRMKRGHHGIQVESG